MIPEVDSGSRGHDASARVVDEAVVPAAAGDETTDLAAPADCDVGTATLVLGDETWHDGVGWYYLIDEYPDEGSCGAFDSAEAAAEHARAAGYEIAHEVPTDREPQEDPPLEHEVRLELASGARLTILYFSHREIRWIFSHRYVGEKQPGRAPEIVNDVRLVAEYVDGLLAARFVLSMHVVVPARLGRQFFAGADVSPGGKTYLEFEYERTGPEYRLAEIRRGARDRVRLGSIPPALLRQVEFPFLVPDRIPAEGQVRVPFLRDAGDVGHFELPTSTLRSPRPGRPDAAPGVLEGGRPE